MDFLVAGLDRLQQQFATAAMAVQIGGKFRCGDADAAGLRFIQSVGHRQPLRVPSRLADLAFLLDQMSALLPSALQNHRQLHRMIVTRVPRGRIRYRSR